ncbi:MAG: helical backbone metal receptor [Woeseiaceae bacterium]|nr:helical backbone metal receptor [Woeseiaceae bacterium]
MIRISMLLAWLALGTIVACQPPAGELPGDETAPPATRIVTLAPHLAELVFAAGAGDKLVGVSAYSDYPQAVRALPIVGDAFMVDQEQLALLRPDLLLAWQSGTPARVVDELRERGYRVEVLQSRGLDDVATAMRQIGGLTGLAGNAERAAAEFSAGLARLSETWRDASPIGVFYQVSGRPLYTVNGDHYVSDLIELCGGRNVFAGLGSLAPLVSEEAVLERNPELLLAADTGEQDTFEHWKRWPSLAANRYGNHFLVPADQVARATPRLVEAGQAICRVLQKGRERRGPERTND